MTGEDGDLSLSCLISDFFSLQETVCKNRNNLMRRIRRDEQFFICEVREDKWGESQRNFKINNKMRACQGEWENEK